MLTVTEQAKKRFLEVAEGEGKAGHGLRVIVSGGGTPAPEFALNFVDPAEAGDEDTTIDVGGLTVYVDPESARWLEGASIDFVDELTQSGFKVGAPNSGVPRPTGPVADEVQRVLDATINPGVAQHGGHVSLVALEDDTVYLKFGGGCQGCGMINVTLKQGVEKILFAEVPQVKKVMDVTDHAAGTNPYYQPAK